MATYNGEKYIKEQITSILVQLSPEDEVVISDDGSTDTTIKIVASLADPRIKLIRNKGMHGYVGNFENVLKHANGDFVFLSDQDDIWMEGKVNTVLSYLMAGNDLIIHNAELVDGNGESLGHDYYSCMHSHSGFWANFFVPRYLGCCMAFNRKVLDYVLPFPTYKRGHDYQIGCYANLRFKTRFIPDVLIKYRRHGMNASPSSEKSNNSKMMKLKKRMSMAHAIILKVIEKDLLHKSKLIK